jgi:hypothetical protein
VIPGDVRIRRRHVLHSLVSVVVLVQLGFAAAFVFDATQTNNVYDALAARYVTVSGRVQGCALLAGGRSAGYYAHVCRVDYHYKGTGFSALVPFPGSMTYVVDPQDASIRMSKVSFDGGPETTTVDLVLATVLFVGATATTTVHVARLRRRRSATSR